MTKSYTIRGTGQNETINRSRIDTNEDVLIHLSGAFKRLVFNQLGGTNQHIQIVPESDEQTLINHLQINDCENLKISGLSRIEVSGTASDLNVSPQRPMVEVNGKHCTVEGLRVYSALDTSEWEPEDWLRNARNAISLRGKACHAQYNDVFNVRIGIAVQSVGGSAFANCIKNFSEDGMRALADHVTLANNQIMMAYDTGSDTIHSDAIQMWDANGNDCLHGVSILYNHIWNRSDFPGARLMQGIGCFDGWVNNARIIGNTVYTDHYHGITLGVAQNSVIEGNFVYSSRPEVRSSWIMIGTNKPTAKTSSSNVLAFNESALYEYKPEMVSKSIANNTVNAQQISERYNTEWLAVA